MRRNIKLTGRKDIPLNAFRMSPDASGDAISFEILSESPFKGHPASARIVLRMTENKMTEQLSFGTVGLPEPAQRPQHSEFRAPSCQLRVVASDEDNFGLVLGSTNSWTLKVKGGNDAPDAGRGILDFQTAKIAPRIWKLDIRDDEHPIIYVDESISNATEWARSDPHFHATVLPVVLERVMGHLIADPENKEYDWAQEWLQWSATLLPDTKAPINDTDDARDAWLDDLVDAFCRKARLLESLQAVDDGGAR